LGLRTGGKEVKLPKTSRMMDQIVEINELNLLKPHDRTALKQFLKIVHDTSPVLNISFGVDPSVAFVEKLVTWLRKEIHPLVLMNVGLQPNMGGGCIVRTTNKQFDFSLRQYFAQKRDLLIKQLAASETTT
jgi:F0F1-type ATP synthase delta subunit